MSKRKIILIFTIILFLISISAIINYCLTKDSNLKPSIKLNGEEEIILNLGEEYRELGAISYLKKKDISDTIEIEGNVNTNKIGIYELTYTSLNKKNNQKAEIKRKVNVVDTISPNITLKGKEEVSLYLNQKYEEPGYEVSDNYDESLDEKVTISGEVDTTKVGTYELTYIVADSSNNTSIAKRKIIIKERPIETNTTNVNTNGRGLPVLMYHFFYDDEAGEKGNDANWMAKTAFEEQMKYLADNNYYFPSWEEVENFIDGKITLPEKSVVVTIDDGDITFINHAIPIIEKYNVKATSFAVTSWNGDWLPKTYGSTHLDFQSHSHDAHRAGSNGKGLLVNMTYEEALNDVTTSKELIGNSTVFCYPFGHYNNTAIKALKDANYHLAFTTAYNYVYPGANKFALPRIRMSRGTSLATFIDKVK